MLKATVLIDNIEKGELAGEWGLSIYIEYMGKKILLDTGASTIYQENARKLGIDLKAVDFGVLSHAHFDHGNGMPAFFEVNPTAKFYISKNCCENCYSMKPLEPIKYIGIPRLTLANFDERIVKCDGKTEISEGITLLSHSTLGLEKIGKRENLYVELEGKMVPDNFNHEQSLIFETEGGLVIFNSCCHAEADVIVDEVSKAFPGKQIAALVGGLHLFTRSEDEVREFAKKVKGCGVPYICTGHCTGDSAYMILEEELGDIVHHLHCGLVMEW